MLTGLAKQQILQRKARSLPWGRYGLPLLVAVVCSLAVLAGVYTFPTSIMQDVGDQQVTIKGLHGPEQNDSFAYAYTNGNASLNIPGIGVGRFIARLRMGGPNSNVPVVAHLAMPSAQVDLGTLERLRVYHVLIPENTQGDLELDIRSTTAQLKTDTRQLGVLLDWVRLESFGLFVPPARLLLITPILLLLLRLALIPLDLSYSTKSRFLFLGSLALGGGIALCRGTLAVHTWQLMFLGLLAVLVTRLPGTIAIGRRRLPGLFSVTETWLHRIDWSSFVLSLRRVGTLFVVWRLALWLFAAIGLWYSKAFNPIGKAITTDGTIIDRSILDGKEFVWTLFAASWMQWDSRHYQSIAIRGYEFHGQHWPNIAFFPLYPLLIRWFYALSGRHTEVAAVIVSHLVLFPAVLLMYHLVTHDFNERVAYRTILFLLLFPTSFYLVAGYTESLALALVVAAVWAMRRQQWWLAGTAGGLLALTRLQGVLIAPVLAVVYLQHYHWRLRAIRASFLAVLLPPLGLMLFMLFQWWRFDTPFAFLIAQRDWDNHLSPPWFMPRMLLDRIRHYPDWPIAVFQLSIWAIFIVLTLLALVRLPLAYGLTLLLLLLPPYLSSWHRSLTRHLLIGFPNFIIIAMLTEQLWIRRILMGVMFVLLAIGMLLFVNGFWIA